MERQKIKSRPGRVVGRGNLAKIHGIFTNILFLLGEMCLLHTLLADNNTDLVVKYSTCKIRNSHDTHWVRVRFRKKPTVRVEIFLMDVDP